MFALAKWKGTTDAIDICLQSVESKVRELESGQQRSMYSCQFPSTGVGCFGCREADPQLTDHDMPDAKVKRG